MRSIWKTLWWLLLACLAGGAIVCCSTLVPPPPKTHVPAFAPVTSKTSPTQSAYEANGDRLLEYVNDLAFVRYSDEERRRTRAYLAKTLADFGWPSEEQPFEGGVNLVARRAGTDPEAGAILVAAHYDTVLESPGADDNASGIATLLEVARLLGKKATLRPLTIVFFDREETGLHGSIAYVAREGNIDNLAGALVLDMVGYACHKAGCQQYPAGFDRFAPGDRGDFLVAVADAEHRPLLQPFQDGTDPPVVTIPVPFKGLSSPDILRSDHAPFWLNDIGAVLLTDTANFRNPHYHQPTDRPETLDRDFFLGSAQAIVDAAAALLDRPGDFVAPPVSNGS